MSTLPLEGGGQGGGESVEHDLAEFIALRLCKHRGGVSPHPTPNPSPSREGS